MRDLYGAGRLDSGHIFSQKVSNFRSIFLFSNFPFDLGNLEGRRRLRQSEVRIAKKSGKKKLSPLFTVSPSKSRFCSPSFFLFPTVLRSRSVPDSNFQIFEHAIFSQFPSSLPEIVGEVPLRSLDGSEKIKNRSP